MRWRSFTVPKKSVVWLIYLGTLLFQPALDPTTTWVDWARVPLIIAVFLPVHGWTERHAFERPYLWRGQPGGLLGIGILLAMGVSLAPVNTGTGVFLIYAAAAGGFLRPRRLAVAAIGAALALVPVAALVSQAEFPYVLYAYLPVFIFTPIIGITNYANVARSEVNVRLKMAHEEIQRLAAVAERERIARDLHDLLGHTLSTITLKAELAGRLTAIDPQRAAVEVNDIESISRGALAQVREAVRGYRSSGLEGEFANARIALGAAGIEYDYFFESLELRPAVENALALALREAVTNVARHAEAGYCQVRLEAQGQRARLTVLDDGKLASGTVAEGNGLSGMRSRVEALGGTMSLSSDGTFTVLAVEVPLSPNGEEAKLGAGVRTASA